MRGCQIADELLVLLRFASAQLVIEVNDREHYAEGGTDVEEQAQESD
jgi:hypothetical protein